MLLFLIKYKYLLLYIGEGILGMFCMVRVLIWLVWIWLLFVKLIWIMLCVLYLEWKFFSLVRCLVYLFFWILLFWFLLVDWKWMVVLFCGVLVFLGWWKIYNLGSFLWLIVLLLFVLCLVINFLKLGNFGCSDGLFILF